MSQRTSNRGDLSEKIAKLQENINQMKLSSQRGNCGSCTPTLLVIAILTPFLLWILLYMTQPAFVQKQEGYRKVRDKYKIFVWTLFITIIVWIILFFVFKNTKGGLSFTCLS